MKLTQIHAMVIGLPINIGLLAVISISPGSKVK